MSNSPNNKSPSRGLPNIRILRRKVTEKPEKEVRVGVYLRASTLEQIHSVPRQEKYALDLAAKLGTLAKIFADAGKTGRTTIGRDGLKEALAFAKSGQMDALIIDGVSRLARDAADTLQLYKQLTHYKVRIYESTGGQALSFIEVAIKGMSAQFENETRATTSAAGRKLAVEQGRSPHRPRYGLVLKPRRKGIRAVHRARSKVVIEIFRRFVEGESAAEIARTLTGHHPTPGDAWRYDCGHDLVEGRSRWTSNMIISIIRCRLYTGKLVDGITKTVRELDDYQVKRYEPQEPENFRKGDVKDKRQHFVSEEVWRRANQIVVERRNSGKRPDHSSRHLLTGRVRCAACEATLASVQSSGNRMYRCDACRKTAKANVNVRVAWVERCVLETIRDKMLRESDVEILIEAMSASRRSRNAARDATERQLRTEIRTRHAQIGRSFELSTMSRDPDDTEEDLRLKEKGESRFRADLEKEIEEREAKIDALPQREPDLSFRPPGELELLGAGIGVLLAALPVRPDADEKPESYPLEHRDPGLTLARESNRRTLALIRILREIVVSVAVSPISSDGRIKVAMKFDPTTKPSADEPATPLLEFEACIDKAAQLANDKIDAASRRVAKLAPMGVDPRHRIGEEVWPKISEAAEDLEQAIAGTGWQAKSLVEAFCLRARTKIRICDLPAAFGPHDTYAKAAEAIKTRWSRLSVALEKHCPSLIEDAFAHLLPSARFQDNRPDTANGASRKPTEEDLITAAELEALAKKQRDPETRCKLAAVAMHFRGSPVSAIAKKYKLRSNRVSGLAWKVRRAGPSALGVFVTEDAPASPAETLGAALREHARRTACPDLEIACIALARASEGVSLIKAQTDSGFGVKQFNKWRAILKAGGPAALAASRWPKRMKDIKVSARFVAKAAQLRTKANEATDPEVRNRLLTLTMYIEGRANPAVAIAGNLDSHAFRNLLDAYRAHGDEALLAGTPSPRDVSPDEAIEAARLDGLAEVISDLETAKRYRMVAGCLRREGHGVIAKRIGVTKPVVGVWYRVFRKSGEAGLKKPAPSAAFTEKQVKRLREIVSQGTDPDDDMDVITADRLARVCLEEFSMPLHPRVLRKLLARHEISLKGLIVRREFKIDRLSRDEPEAGEATT